MAHLFLMREDRVPSCGMVVEMECGKRLLFVDGREGRTEEADCPGCQENIQTLEAEARGRGLALIEGCRAFIFEE